MPQYLIPLIGDAGPNDGTATPNVAHYLNVDEDPHDSDTTRLREVQGNIEAFACDWSVIPSDAIITSVVLRWTAKPVQAEGDTEFEAGFRIGGVNFHAAPRAIEFGSSYVTFEEIFTTDPVTMQTITRARLIALWEVIIRCSVATLEVGFPRLTQCVPLVNTSLPPTRPTAIVGSVVSTVAAAGQGPSGPSVVVSPAAAVVQVTPAADVVESTPSAVAGAQTPTGTPTPIVGKSSGAGVKPTGTPSAVVSTTTIAAATPTGTPAAVTPEAEEI